jgi:5'-3' exonuclease
MDKVLLIDGLNAIHRASHVVFGSPKKHHPISDLKWGLRCDCGGDWIENRCVKDQGEDLNDIDYVPIFNFFRSLRPTIEKFQPDKCFFVLEGHPKFRYELFSDYKANRKQLVKTSTKTKDEVYAYADEIVRLLMFMPITICRAADYECDDVIGSLAENMKDEELTVLSNDTDYIQLLQRGYPKVQVYNPIRKEFMVAPPYPYLAWKSLRGDKSDHVPGLVGDKKAERLCTTPTEFEKFMSIEENRANFAINRKLIEFANVPMEEIEFREGTRNFSALKVEFEKMKFDSITNNKSWDKFVITFNCLRY